LDSKLVVLVGGERFERLMESEFLGVIDEINPSTLEDE
jgi:hypothetical protein